METKVCSRCGVEKSVNEFYKRLSSADGLRTDCKLCGKLDTERWRKTNRNRCNEIRRLSNLKHRETIMERAREYRKTTKYQQYLRDSLIKRRTRLNSTPNLINTSRKKFKLAVSKGEIIRQKCQYPFCQSSQSEGHHWDYSKPYFVTWFCERHHALADRIRRLIVKYNLTYTKNG